MLVSPGWTTYAPQVNLSGRSPLTIIQTSASTKWKLTPSLLESAIQNCNSLSNKLLIFNNPGNPCKIVFNGSHKHINIMKDMKYIKV